MVGYMCEDFILQFNSSKHGRRKFGTMGTQQDKPGYMNPQPQSEVTETIQEFHNVCLESLKALLLGCPDFHTSATLHRNLGGSDFKGANLSTTLGLVYKYYKPIKNCRIT